MNVDLFERIKTNIKAKPKAFTMERFFGFSENSPCGTTACIAGWALTLEIAKSNRPSDGLEARMNGGCFGYSTERKATELLGLTLEQGEELFFHWHWDNDQAKAYEEARTPADRAQVACDYIDYFIAKHEGTPAAVEAP